jgi:dTMP kinase
MFITFEGPEGSGKTTQMAILANFLKQEGLPVLATREPGGTLIGEQIRQILFDKRHADMHARTEILLFQASRAQLVERVIRPHLDRGGLVLGDRYADSTLAYQGYGYQLDIEQLRSLIHFATGGLKPDLTLLLDIQVEEGLRRRTSDGDVNRLDGLDLDFHRRVRQGYLEMANAEPQRWVIIDASRPIDDVQADIRQVVMPQLKTKS